MSSKAINAWQGAVGLVGITLGAIPLVMFLVRGAAGSVWQLVGDAEGTLGWAGPLAVVLVAVAVIAALERGKKHSP